MKYLQQSPEHFFNNPRTNVLNECIENKYILKLPTRNVLIFEAMKVLTPRFKLICTIMRNAPSGPVLVWLRNKTKTLKWKEILP